MSAASKSDIEPAGIVNGNAPLPLIGQGFVLTSYVQSQYETHQDSVDELRQNGAPLNQNRFVLRRARVRLDREWDHAGFTLELDGNSTNGMAFGVRRAEGSILIRRPGDPNGPPIARATVGLFNTPFGYELVESPRVRHFMERSFGSRAMFPGEPDIGARLSGAYGFLRYQIAVVNGEPIDENNGFPGRDPSSSKDLVIRIGADHTPTSKLRISGGASMLKGKGFHPGTRATKNTTAWRDSNEDGIVQPSELVGVPGAAATASQAFDRWAVGADLQIRLRTWLGDTELFAELVSAANMDRGLFVADPVQTGHDLRELSYYVSVSQQITPYGLVGFRTELYNPNADSLDKLQGKPVPTSQRMRIYSPMVGLTLPRRAKLLFQVDFINDLLAKDPRGVPIDLRNDTATVRLQVEL